MTFSGIDWQRAKWSGFASKYIKFGEKVAVRFADEIIVLSEGVQKYFKDTYGRETVFIPNAVNRPEIREAKLIKEKFGLDKDSYILFLGRIVPEKGISYLIEAFKQIETDILSIIITIEKSHGMHYFTYIIEEEKMFSEKDLEYTYGRIPLMKVYTFFIHTELLSMEKQK